MNIFINSHQVISNYSLEEANRIKGDLTKPNPLYKSAQMFSPYKRVYVPEFLYYYKEDKKKKTLTVPRGYSIPFNHTIIGEEYAENTVTIFPEFQLELRDAQKNAAKAYLELENTGDSIIVMPTGSGKSILGLYLASVLRQKTLIIVNKDDLISGWKDDAKLCFGEDFKPGLIKAKKFDIGEQITLATIQTLSKLPEDKLDIVKKTFNTLIVDEQHRAAAKTYSFVNNMPAYNRIGLTATDIRNDGLRDVLTFYFGNVVYRCSEEEVKEDIISADKIEVKIKESDIFYKEAKRYRWVDDGALVTEIELLKPNKIITSKDKEWKDAIKELLLAGEIKKIPLNVAKINNIINGNEEFLRGVCKDIAEEYFLGKSCVVFCKEKELVRKLGSLLNSLNIPENQLIYYYGDSKIDKAEMKKIAESKESLITLTTLAMATEGTNVKAWERIFLVSSIANRKDLIQAIGRVRRTKEGKELVRIYDYSHPYIDGVKQHISVRLKYYEEKGFKITQ